MPRQMKYLRKFNGKFYTRALVAPNERIAHIHRNNFHGRGIKALIIKSGTHYQIWARKGD